MAPSTGRVVLDLGSAAGHWNAVAWIRQNVILIPVAARVLSLDVNLPNGRRVNLFMNVADHYIMAFQGRDAIYVLDDPHRDAFKKSMIASGLATERQLKDMSLGSDHDSLHTLNEQFTMADLMRAAALSDYSDRDDGTYEHVRRAMSLLICMIAECSRLWGMQRMFRNLYEQQNQVVKADEGIKSWKDASLVQRLANQYFPNYPWMYAVEKLSKRAAELRTLLAAIEGVLGKPANRQTFVQHLIDRRVPNPGAAAAWVDRFAEIAAELRIRTAEQLTELMTACANSVAVLTAKDGVTMPPLDFPHR